MQPGILGDEQLQMASQVSASSPVKYPRVPLLLPTHRKGHHKEGHLKGRTLWHPGMASGQELLMGSRCSFTGCTDPNDSPGRIQ